ncbi:hypothetical protein, partial [Staphylococcus aureus]
MRHAQITETMGTYSHLYTQKKHDAIAIFDKYIQYQNGINTHFRKSRMA